MELKPKTDIDSLFVEARQNNKFLKVCAPMVRYSKLQFRKLVRQYGVDLCFTPMILADSFCQSSKARYNEFSTDKSDTPLIVQFAAKTTYDFVGASEHVYHYADGVDLNCGCPQRWAMKDGYGCSLLKEPEIIHSLVREFKNRLPNDFSVSVKIRLLNDFKSTVDLCRRLENCGINFLTIHARKMWQKSSETPDYNSLKNLKDILRIPLIGNGNVKSLDDANAMFDEVKCDGIMAAQGILTNPAMFTDSVTTPINCVQNWINICHSQKQPVNFQCFHHHLVFMLEKILKKKQKQVFNNLTTFDSVYDFLENCFEIRPENLHYDESHDIKCVYESEDYSTLINRLDSNNAYDPNLTHGKYFMSLINKNNNCDLDNMDATLFNEE